jgi:PTH1 family peptidyl-tRNA hydrolase
VWLIVGLGNPGPRYERHRHNIGFRVIDRLAERYRIGAFRSKFSGEIATGGIEGEKVVLLKPMEYMNLSGFAVQRAAQFHHIDIDRIVVAHDEIDFEMGRIQIKAGGGAGGHNGLRSLIEQLGGDGFVRVRIGVGRPPRGDAAGRDKRVSGYVLSDFPSAQADEVDRMTQTACDGIAAILRRGVRAAMNELNRKASAAAKDEAAGGAAATGPVNSPKKPD